MVPAFRTPSPRSSCAGCSRRPCPRHEVNYELSYTHLPRWWRKIPAGRLDVNSSRAHHGDSTVAFSVDGRGVETCTSGPTGGWMLMGRSSTPCGPRELPNLPPPGLWPLKFLLFYPVPLLPAEAGPSAEMPTALRGPDPVACTETGQNSDE